MKVDQLLTAAQRAEATGQISRAVQLCNMALAQEPDAVPALLLLGSIAARFGRVDEAVTNLRRAVSVDPNCYDGLRWLATLLIGKDGGTEAEEFGRHVVALRPKAADAHACLGLAALGSGNNVLAIESFHAAILLNPEMAGAYHNLGVAFQRDEAFNEAIEAYQNAIRLKPSVFETYLHLGRSYLASEEPALAIKSAECALKINPNSVSAKRLLSEAKFNSVLSPEGEQTIQEMMVINPTSGFPYALLASLQQEKGDFEAANQSLNTSIELQPAQGLAYYLQAQNRNVQGDEAEMYERLEQMAAAKTLDPTERRYLHFALGKAFDDLKQFERAIHHFDLANGERASNQILPPSADSIQYAWRVRKTIEMLDSEFLSRFRDAGSSSAKPIFIVGMPRSGTTLLEQILSRHSAVGSAGELSFWRDRGRRIMSLSTETFHPDELFRGAQDYLALLQKQVGDTERVTDKFPSNYLYLGLLYLAFPNAKFIHAKRHPIDTCLSMYMRPFFTIHEMGRTRRRLVETYQLYLESMAHWRTLIPPSSLIEIDYESLVTHPEQIIPRLIGHCELDWEDACLHPEAATRRVQTFSKWQVRQPVYTTSVERWRNYEPWLGVFKELLSAQGS